MNLAKLNKKLEIFWWWMAGITFVMVFVLIIMQGADKWSAYLLAPIIAAVLALVRRFMAKRLARSEAEYNNQQK